MKVIILGGFLGSGKTTVLLQFARYLTEVSLKGSADGGSEPVRPGRAPVVILENEISEAGVDNRLLSQANFTVETIFSGCICCTSSAQLSESVRQIRERYDPAWLLIEATGMACPDDVRKNIIELTDIDTHILALADAKRWMRVVRAMPVFVKSQLADADVILVNKIDLVDQEALDAVTANVREFNDSALLCQISAAERQPDAFWEQVTDALLSGKKEA